MKAETILLVLYISAMVLGLAILVVSDNNDVAGTVIGIGAFIIGLLGYGIHEIVKAIRESAMRDSREANQS